MERDSVTAYVHMRRDTALPLHAPVHILDDPLVTYILNGWPISQPKDK